MLAELVSPTAGSMVSIRKQRSRPHIYPEVSAYDWDATPLLLANMVVCPHGECCGRDILILVSPRKQLDGEA